MFETLEAFDTEYSADSVEWCPAKNFKDIFVCGTYQLAAEDEKTRTKSTSDTEKKKRIGRIYLFQVVKNDKVKLQLLQQLEVSAVLDMKWSHVKCFGEKILLGVVNAEGFLQIYELCKESEKVHLKLAKETLVNDTHNSTLALSLDWSTGNKNESNDDADVRIVVSDSQGSISVFRLGDNATNIDKINSWHAHEFEAWIAAFDYWNTNIVYTGGDDCKFLRFDTRLDTADPILTNRCHNAGVTSIHSNWRKEFSLVTGSYDENIRTWDLRNLRRPIAELNLGGGIWRLKWDPYEARYLLAACMYNGFFVVDSDNLEVPEVITEYQEHKSIAYGCDWSHLNIRSNSLHELLDDENTTLVATCSFYDHLLQLSSFKFKELNIA